jgi:proline iminopeptidase
MRRVMMAAVLTAAASCAQKPAEPAAADRPAPPSLSAAVFPIEAGFVDANGVLIYYEALGKGEPLLIVHGGPGASHDYFLPYLLPLARTNRVIFIDERGSGKSEKLEDPKDYTVENMVEDVEAVRDHLGLGKIGLLGHSYGGVPAQASAFKYQANLSHLVKTVADFVANR